MRLPAAPDHVAAEEDLRGDDDEEEVREAATVAEQIRSLKRFPDQQILVAAIAGPTAPYTVHWTRAADGSEPAPHVVASCTAADGSAAAPAIRIADWVRSFGDNGIVLSACDADYGPTADRIARLLNEVGSQTAGRR